MVKINAKGELVREGESETTTATTRTTSASDTPLPMSVSPRSTLASSRRLDVFGFNLEPRQALLVLCLIYFMSGFTGGMSGDVVRRFSCLLYSLL